MKVLLTGAGGQLGQALIASAPQELDLVATSRWWAVVIWSMIAATIILPSGPPTPPSQSLHYTDYITDLDTCMNRLIYMESNWPFDYRSHTSTRQHPQFSPCIKDTR